MRLLLTTVLLLLALAAPAAADSLTFVSEPGDWPGGGQARTFTDADSAFAAEFNEEYGEQRVFIDPRGDRGSGWQVRLSGPDGTRPTVGLHSHTDRFPRPGEALLDVSGENRGCGDVVGRFEVRDIAYDAAGQLTRLWLLFDQTCSELGGPGMSGELRFGDDPATVPSIARWRSVDLGETVTRPVTFVAPGASTMGAVAVTGPDADQFELVSDACRGAALAPGGRCQAEVRYAPDRAGEAAATLWFRDGSTSWPVPLQANAWGGVTRIDLRSPEGDTAGNGRTYSWTPADSGFHMGSLGEGYVAASVLAAGRYESVSFGARSGNRLTPGTYTARISSATPTDWLNVLLHDGRCDDRQGTFVVTDHGSWPDGTLRSFAATLEQRCSETAPAMTGSVSYRVGDSTPAPAWEPAEPGVYGPLTPPPAAGPPPPPPSSSSSPAEPPPPDVAPVPPTAVPLPVTDEPDPSAMQQPSGTSPATTAAVPDPAVVRAIPTTAGPPGVRAPASVSRRAVRRRGVRLRVTPVPDGLRLVVRHAGRRVPVRALGAGAFQVRLAPALLRSLGRRLSLRVTLRSPGRPARTVTVAVRVR